MQRAEKRSLPADGSPPSAAPGPPAHKKAREKMPDFDWSADNYRLTWALVEELKRPENKSVLFPDQENLPIKVNPNLRSLRFLLAFLARVID